MNFSVLFFLVLVNLCLSQRIMTQTKLSGDSFLGKSVSVACNQYIFSGAPGSNLVIMYDSETEEETVITSPRNSTNFGTAISSHCLYGKPVLLAVAPGNFVALYHVSWDKPDNVMTLNAGEGYSISSSGIIAVLSGSVDSNSTSSNLVVLNLYPFMSTVVPIGSEVPRNYAFSISVRYISDDEVLILVGSPGHVVKQNGTFTPKSGGLVTLLKGSLSNASWTFTEIYNEVQENEYLFGTSVSLSADGSFAIIGSPQVYNSTNRHNERPQGRVTFIRKSDTAKWSSQSSIFGANYTFFDFFGLTVSLPETGNDKLAVGSLNYRGQFRVFIFHLNGTKWELFTSRDTPLSIHLIRPNAWANVTFFESRNFSMALTNESVVAGVTFYSDKEAYLNEGAVFLISTLVLPFPAWGVASIGMGVLFLFGFVMGLSYYFASSASRRDRAYKEVI